MTDQPPIKGMWVVESSAELTPEVMQHAKEVLIEAAERNQQVVVVEDIEFRWRPVTVDRMADYKAVVEALERLINVGDALWEDHPPVWMSEADSARAALARLRSEVAA